MTEPVTFEVWQVLAMALLSGALLLLEPLRLLWTRRHMGGPHARMLHHLRHAARAAVAKRESFYAFRNAAGLCLVEARRARGPSPEARKDARTLRPPPR